MFETGRDLRHHFTMTYLEMVNSLASLKRLLARVKKYRNVPRENMGICDNWESDFSYALVSYFGCYWPKSAHPGERHPYPIDCKGHLWKGNNKELRIDLMEFIADKMEQLIKEDSQQSSRTGGPPSPTT